MNTHASPALYLVVSNGHVLRRSSRRAMGRTPLVAPATPAIAEKLSDEWQAIVRDLDRLSIANPQVAALTIRGFTRLIANLLTPRGER